MKRYAIVSKKDDVSRHVAALIKEELKELLYDEEHPEIVDKILKEGTEKARKVAKETMKDVKKAMKLDYFEE